MVRLQKQGWFRWHTVSTAIPRVEGYDTNQNLAWGARLLIKEEAQRLFGLG